MTISTLVDLMVGRREADGAVVVALLRWARRHFLCCVDGVNSSFLGALCLPLWDCLSRAAFFMTGASLTRRTVSCTVILRKWALYLLVCYLSLASTLVRQGGSRPLRVPRHTAIARRLAVSFRWPIHL